VTVTAAHLTLKGDELEVAAGEVRAVRDLVHEGEYRDTLDAILAGLEDDGVIREEHEDEVDRLLTLALQAGRVRALYGPGGEQAALKLFRRLPTGAELSATAKAVNEALGALAGRTLEQASISAVGPGAFTLSVVTEGAELSVKLDRQGVRVGSVAL
jgi:hypothetical protein